MHWHHLLLEKISFLTCPGLETSILTETVILTTVLILIIQSSSLIRRLLLVFFSIVVIFILNINMVYSGVLCYIFIIIFIGGLIVLLVRVSSTVQQEQGLSPNLVVLITLTSGLLFSLYTRVDWGLGSDSRETRINLITFVTLIKRAIVLGILVILVICLLVLTKLLLDYKGITRNF